MFVNGGRGGVSGFVAACSLKKHPNNWQLKWQCPQYFSLVSSSSQFHVLNSCESILEEAWKPGD